MPAADDIDSTAAEGDTSPSGAILATSVHRRRPKRSLKVSEVVARELLDYILDEGLGPGSKLPPESEMVKSFRVGRGSLREALRILETHGLISIRPGPGGGPVLERVGPRDVARLMTFYLKLEGITFAEVQLSSRLLLGAMAAESARVGNFEVVAQMRAAIERAAAATELFEFGQAMRQFYGALFLNPGGEFLNLVNEAVRQIMLVRVGTHITLGELQASLTSHSSIVAAIDSGDPEVASQRMRAHYEELDHRYERAVPGLLGQTVDWR